ncbi:EF-hand domain-containing protein [Sphingomonas solaris]|nr:EF-hand domain-containing protein [Sphingomonas solaris]
MSPRPLMLLAPMLIAVAAPLPAAPSKAPPAKAAPVAGDVTRAQMLKEVNGVFDVADTDKDGFMSRAEFRVRMGAVLNRTPPGTAGAPSKPEAQAMLDAADAAFKRVDSDGDGKLSRAEATKRPLAAFDMMDANHDGILTVAEKAAARSRETDVPAGKAIVKVPPAAR